MKNVMSKAWAIAKKAQSRFGGKVSEYIAGALRQAWEIFKAQTETPAQTKARLQTSFNNEVAKMKGAMNERAARFFAETFALDADAPFWEQRQGISPAKFFRERHATLSEIVRQNNHYKAAVARQALQA